LRDSKREAVQFSWLVVRALRIVRRNKKIEKEMLSPLQGKYKYRTKRTTNDSLDNQPIIKEIMERKKKKKWKCVMRYFTNHNCEKIKISQQCTVQQVV
jgi:hypothetical protein